MALTLVLGPRRSGKSAVAEQLAGAAGGAVIYVAPLTPTDAEMQARVAAHRARRPESWTTVETMDIAAAVAQAPPGQPVLVDSLGTWLAELLWRAGALEGGTGPDPAPILEQARALTEHAAARDGEVVVVAEEAGWGPVPPSPATRRWLDLLGDCSQLLARHADRALLVVAGRILELP